MFADAESDLNSESGETEDLNYIEETDIEDCMEESDQSAWWTADWNWSWSKCTWTWNYSWMWNEFYWTILNYAYTSELSLRS